MDIAIVTTWAVDCGIATYSENLSDALRAKGHRVTILAEKDPRAPQAGGTKDVYRIWDRRAAYAAPMGLKALLTAIVQAPKRPDIVHIQHEHGLFPDHAGFFTFLDGLKQHGIRVALTLHTVTCPPKLAGFFLEYAERPNLTTTTIVHTWTAAAALHGWGIGGSIRVIPHGVTLVDRNVERSLLQPQFLCPGFMGKSKGQLEILHAAGLLRARGGDFHLSMIGRCRDQVYLEWLQQNIQEHALQSYMTFREEFVSEERMREAFRRAHVVILGASDTTPFSASGQLHTALGYGLPVLAKAVPIYQEGSDGGVIYYRNAEKLAFLMRSLSRNLTVLDELSSRSRKAAEARAWPLVAEKTVEAYGEAL